jgi:hypothetical protein
VQVHNLVSYLIGSTELVVTIKYCLLGKRYFSNIALVWQCEDGMFGKVQCYGAGRRFLTAHRSFFERATTNPVDKLELTFLCDLY